MGDDLTEASTVDSNPTAPDRDLRTRAGARAREGVRRGSADVTDTRWRFSSAVDAARHLRAARRP